MRYIVPDIFHIQFHLTAFDLHVLRKMLLLFFREKDILRKTDLHFIGLFQRPLAAVVKETDRIDDVIEELDTDRLVIVDGKDIDDKTP